MTNHAKQHFCSTLISTKTETPENRNRLSIKLQLEPRERKSKIIGALFFASLFFHPFLLLLSFVVESDDCFLVGSTTHPNQQQPAKLSSRTSAQHEIVLFCPRHFYVAMVRSLEVKEETFQWRNGFESRLGSLQRSRNRLKIPAKPVSCFGRFVSIGRSYFNFLSFFPIEHPRTRAQAEFL